MKRPIRPIRTRRKEEQSCPRYEFGRGLRTPTEKEFWKQAYKLGMQNPWASGRAEIEDGNFIVEEDRLNPKSVSVIENLETLRRFFIHGNWCLGQAVIYKNLCFINQINGGDEWLTMKRFSDGTVRSFESITFRPMAMNYWDDDEDERRHLQMYLDSSPTELRGMPKSYYERQKYFEKYIDQLLRAKVFPSKNTPGRYVVVYGEDSLKEYAGMKPVAT